MLCAESLTTLLYPFKWPHTYVPILPQQYVERNEKAYLEAPQPFIMGLCYEEEIPVEAYKVSKTSVET